MYDELICKLRNNAEFLEIASLHQTPADGFAATMREAADAIEALSRMEKTTQWVPVTERLPEKTGKYLVCGQWRGEPAETWVCELIAFGKIKGWANEARNPAVTHWMPLPEPPKEEQGDV